MATLPSIQDLQACPHCGGEEFYVVQRYSGRGVYRRTFDGHFADNSHMYDCLNTTVGKRAFCSDCEVPVARWDEDQDGEKYNKRREDHGPWSRA